MALHLKSDFQFSDGGNNSKLSQRLTPLKYFLAVVVAQLAEWSLPTPEIRGLNPDITNEILRSYLSVNCYPDKTKINKKKPGMAH